MGIDTLSLKTQEKLALSRIISGTLMIAGTAIGAGMLGIPLLTAQAGFWPAIAITFSVWLFMLATGLLFLEVSLWMPEGSNILSMAKHFLGIKGKVMAGGLFLFLYYCLMIAYFAAGAPLLMGFVERIFGVAFSGWAGYLVFGALFGFIVALGAKSIDRVNMILTVAMVISYAALLSFGSSEVETSRLQVCQWSAVLTPIPVLFSAFGFHNVIPSLCTYLKRDQKSLKLSIILGTSIALVFYLLWQWLIIGSIPSENIQVSLMKGAPATQALEAVTGSPWVFKIGQSFAFFAIVTSMLGVSFSLVDFIGDGLKISRKGFYRIFLTLLTFVPPFIFSAMDPSIFDRALGYAGGFGEAVLNGLLPVCFVWIGRYVHGQSFSYRVKGGKFLLAVLFAVSVFVIGLEAFYVLKN